MPRQQDTKTSKGAEGGASTSTQRTPEASASGTSGVAGEGAGVMSQARETVSNVADQATTRISSRLDAQKDRAAEGLTGLARVLRQASQQLREQNQTGFIHEYLDSATNQVERFANYIRGTDVRRMMGEVEHFARRQPAVFYGGAFALGLLGARFIKSSSRIDGQSRGQSGSMMHDREYENRRPGTESIGRPGEYAGTAGQGTGPWQAGGRQTSGSTQPQPTEHWGGV